MTKIEQKKQRTNSKNLPSIISDADRPTFAELFAEVKRRFDEELKIEKFQTPDNLGPATNSLLSLQMHYDIEKSAAIYWERLYRREVILTEELLRMVTGSMIYYDRVRDARTEGVSDFMALTSSSDNYLMCEAL